MLGIGVTRGVERVTCENDVRDVLGHLERTWGGYQEHPRREDHHRQAGWASHATRATFRGALQEHLTRTGPGSPG